MARGPDRAVTLGPVRLRSPLIGASGTVGSAVDFAVAGDLKFYGALVAKSVSRDPWPGNPPPRLAPAGAGMLNGIGVQNPGIEAWAARFGPRLGSLPVPVWGSAVGRTPGEFAAVARGLEEAGCAAVEANLSCPNLEGESLIALDPDLSGRVTAAVRSAVSLPVGVKLSPNAPDIAAAARAVAAAGADWLVLTNTAWGAAVDVETGRPRLAGMVGGYSGPPLKPLAMRCVAEVSRALPEVPIVGCGGVVSGEDVVEYMMAGAAAAAIGTAHFSEPRAARRIDRELARWCRRRGVGKVSDLTGAMTTAPVK